MVSFNGVARRPQHLTYEQAEVLRNIAVAVFLPVAIVGLWYFSVGWRLWLQ